MRILGIDPGIATVGFGILDYDGKSFKPVEYGVVTSPPDAVMPTRLKMLYDDMVYIIDRYRPEEIAVEELFFNNNAKTAIVVGQARGVLILSASNHDVPVFEYTPLQVKAALVGYGRADKNQVGQMVRQLLKLQSVPKPDDTADALAIAVCHGYSRRVFLKQRSVPH